MSTGLGARVAPTRWAMRLALSRLRTTWRCGRSNGSLAAELSGNGRTDLTIKLPAQWGAMMVNAATDPAKVRGIRKVIRLRNPGRADPVRLGTDSRRAGTGKSQCTGPSPVQPSAEVEPANRPRRFQLPPRLRHFAAEGRSLDLPSVRQITTATWDLRCPVPAGARVELPVW